MAFQQVTVELVRDGQCTPWGFRLTGGADIGAPLVIQKINLGSPSEGELYKGDIIMRVREAEAKCLSHRGATELISKSGNTLKLVVARCSGLAAPIGLSTLGKPTTLYHLQSSGTTSPPLLPLLTPTPSDGNQYLFKPLPTTNFSQTKCRRTSVESYASTASSENEKEAIVNQPYRSTPLITPSAKTSKDIIVGSYLRHQHSGGQPSASANAHSRLSDAYMLSAVQEAVLEAAQTASRTPTPDMSHQNGPQVYLRQYNSPINMYSNQAIVEAIMSQTSTTKPQMNDVGVRDPTKTPLNITTSPTYQLIHDEEWRNLHKGNLKEHRPLEEHVHNVDGCQPHADIHQSGSFNMLKNTLQGVNLVHGISDF